MTLPRHSGLDVVELRPPMPRALAAFTGNAELLSLRSLAGEWAPGQRVFGAVQAGAVVGVTSLMTGLARDFEDHEGMPAKLVATYLCSTEVAAELRGHGIGSLLYSARLEVAKSESASMLLEILGSGRPGSVAPGARNGLRWHLRRGFSIIGASLEPDRGPVLFRRESRRADVLSR
jgi:GNAT superfamily N-acetyltransferase